MTEPTSWSRFESLRYAELLRGELSDPFSFFGPHGSGGVTRIRGFFPGATSAEIIDAADQVRPMLRRTAEGLYEAEFAQAPAAYRFRIHWPDAIQEAEDPYAYGLLLGALDLHLFAEGKHRQLGRRFGAQLTTVDGVAGVRFAVWAPNARRVSVVGDFNQWDGRRHPMRCRVEAGVWELFIPRLAAGALYKFELLGADGALHLKADPLALQTEPAPGTASVVFDWRELEWHDAEWLDARAERQSADAPITVYELHAGSWQRNDFGLGESPSWDELAARLVPYVAGLGFTHIELMPIMEHPFGGSWGYQPLSLFAPTARYGSPAAFARFVDACHLAGIGVILDWVPAHFPSDAHGLLRFDGTALYEHQDPREGFHPDWNTLIYNFGRREVVSFLIASALHWIEQFHVDGLRVDAVASMLYRDYSRRDGEWVPNVYGGRENLEAVDFLRQLNLTIEAESPGTIVIAEESTAWPGVTRPAQYGGLGFAYKWNMGWMHDTLRYFARDPVHRKYHHDDITFGPLYAFSEQFMLPLSHDEVVHLKRSLFEKMPGDPWQRHANLRALYALMWAYPGKKLLFMGGELAQIGEWDHDRQLEWHLLADHRHAGMQRLVGDLNRLYRKEPALHRWDCDGRGFSWVIVDDRDNSVFAWLRRGPDDAPAVLVVCNLTPAPRHGYQVGVPFPGRWHECLNTDAGIYGGGNIGNAGALFAKSIESHGEPATLALTLPPLAVLILRHDPGY